MATAVGRGFLPPLLFFCSFLETGPHKDPHGDGLMVTTELNEAARPPNVGGKTRSLGMKTGDVTNMDEDGDVKANELKLRLTTDTCLRIQTVSLS